MFLNSQEEPLWFVYGERKHLLRFIIWPGPARSGPFKWIMSGHEQHKIESNSQPQLNSTQLDRIRRRKSQVNGSLIRISNRNNEIIRIKRNEECSTQTHKQMKLSGVEWWREWGKGGREQLSGPCLASLKTNKVTFREVRINSHLLLAQPVSWAIVIASPQTLSIELLTAHCLNEAEAFQLLSFRSFVRSFVRSIVG